MVLGRHKAREEGKKGLGGYKMRPAKADEEFKWDFVRRAICGFHRLLRRWKRNKL